jgi:hypothetical protein
MTTLSLRPSPLSLCALGAALGLSLVVPRAVAQQPATPVVAAPVHLVPPPAPALTAAPSRAPAPAPTVKRLGPPPDSVRPAAAPVVVVPANAVAQCGDGTFMVAPDTPGGCASHRGIRVVMPARAAPAPPGATRPVAAPMTLQAGALSSAPPAGATMRCKDGTFQGGAPSEAACATHGGLATALVAPRPAPVGPAQVRRP